MKSYHPWSFSVYSCTWMLQSVFVADDVQFYRIEVKECVWLQRPSKCHANPDANFTEKRYALNRGFLEPPKASAALDKAGLRVVGAPVWKSFFCFPARCAEFRYLPSPVALQPTCAGLFSLVEKMSPQVWLYASLWDTVLINEWCEEPV